MWPRTEEDRLRGHLCGFVAFMKRDDGAVALRELQDKEIMGSPIRLNWGKAVRYVIPLLLCPLYRHPTLA